MFQHKFEAFHAAQPVASGPFNARIPTLPAVVESAVYTGTALQATPQAKLKKLEPFDPSQPLLPHVSNITIAQALACEHLAVTSYDAPTAEESGGALLGETDLRNAKTVHLEATRIRFLDVPFGERKMHERIEWMWHAGSRSADDELAARALEAIDVMTAQVTVDGDFVSEFLAENLSLLAHDHPKIVDALFMGDLDDVPDLIDAAVRDGANEAELVEPAAWMFLTWGAFEQQREACLGWRLIHRRLDDVWGAEKRKSWTVGQIFRPKTQQHAFALELKQIYTDNLERGVDRLTDKRTINRIEKTLRSYNIGWCNRRNETEIIAMFGKDRISRLPALLGHFSADADAYHRRYLSLLTGPDGENRAGRRADMLAARISAAHRAAIVCARTCHLGTLASNAQTSDALRAMLDAHLPRVLAPSGKRLNTHKLRLRQLFHAVRIEFLCDGEHLPKGVKGAASSEHMVLPLELDKSGSRRAHELFDQCFVELTDQPADWRFITPFGWQCDGKRRMRLSAVS